MLTQLRIHDFAIVEALELELTGGMTAVTGETGAGKSILVDAIGLLLGDRADAGTIRHGAERTDISAVFDLDALPAARAWLSERDLDGEDCHLRRVIARNGRSRSYINGVPQPDVYKRQVVRPARLDDAVLHFLGVQNQHDQHAIFGQRQKFHVAQGHHLAARQHHDTRQPGGSR